MHAPSELVPASSFLLAILLLIAAAKVGAEISERFGQPSVLGEIIAGILIGATGFGLITRGIDPSTHQAIFRVFGLHGSEGAATYQALDVMAEVGVIVLLFEIGLHSDLYELRKVGMSALWVGVAGVVLPFVGGYACAHYAFHLDTFPSLFIGAALTATSVGITARVFRDLNLLHTPESQVVLGAAVADDVIGLIILAVLTALAFGTANGGSQNLWLLGAKITFIAVGFLVAAVVIGVKSVPMIDRILGKMQSRGSVTVLALAFCLAMALLGQVANLAPIVGAFAGGLVLSHCGKRQEIQDGIKPLADIFIPVFFAMMGTVVNLRSVFAPSEGGPSVLMITLALVVIGVIGKVAGCATVPDPRLNRMVVGLAMIPRGEVGLIFARLGIQHGYVTGAVYDGIVLMVLLTTIMTPPLLRIAGRQLAKAKDRAPLPPHINSLLDREDGELFDIAEMLEDGRQVYRSVAPRSAPQESKGVTPPAAI